MNRTQKLILAGFMVLGTGNFSAAAPIDFRNVPAEAKWFTHLDVDGLRQTTLAHKLREWTSNDPELQGPIHWLQQEYGLDAWKDLQGVTTFGTSYRAESGSTIVFANFNRGRVEAGLKNQPGSKATASGNHTLFTWRMMPPASENGASAEFGPAPGPATEMCAALHGQNALVLGTSTASVKKALDVLDGKSENLKNDSPLASRVPDGTVFSAAAVELSQLKDASGAFTILQQAAQVTFALGESDQTMFAVGHYAAKSPDVAKEVETVGEGVKAFLRLRGNLDSHVAKVVDGLKLKTDSENVMLDWRAESSEVVQIMDQIRTHMEALQRIQEQAFGAPDSTAR